MDLTRFAGTASLSLLPGATALSAAAAKVVKDAKKTTSTAFIGITFRSSIGHRSNCHPVMHVQGRVNERWMRIAREITARRRSQGIRRLLLKDWGATVPSARRRE